MRNCHLWNQAALGKFVWKIAQKEDMLWIKWVHSVYIKDSSWWEYEPPQQASWGWKIICKMKNHFKRAYVHNQWLNRPKEYTIHESYKWLTGDQEKVPWYHWVWNKFNIPKHSLISWLATMGKLRTRDKLYHSGVNTQKECLFCSSEEDSCEHLFFRCAYSTQVCRGIKQWLQIHTSQTEYLYTGWKNWGRRFRSRKQ